MSLFRFVFCWHPLAVDDDRGGELGASHGGGHPVEVAGVWGAGVAHGHPKIQVFQVIFFQTEHF